MRLKNWTDEQRHRLLEIIAENRSVSYAYKVLQSEVDNLWDYPYNTVKAYVQSDQGREDYLDVLAGIKKQHETRGFANKDNRLTGLLEIAVKWMEAFRDMAEEKQIVGMREASKEFRETLKLIREEVGDGVVEEDAARSFFKKLQATADALPKKEQEALFGSDQGSGGTLKVH